MHTFFLTCAVLGAVILIAQLVLGIFGAGHAHGGDHHIGTHHDGTSDGLQLLSARALSAAIAFFGIGALGAASLSIPSPIAAGIGAITGIAAMFGVAIVMRSMLKFEHDGSINIQRAVGESATVYIPVPGSEQGFGKVTLTLQGRTVEYQAVTSDGETLATGSAVLIVEVRNDDTVEVVPLPSIDGVS